MSMSTTKAPFYIKYYYNALVAVESFLNDNEKRIEFELPLEWLLKRRKDIIKDLLRKQIKEFDRSQKAEAMRHYRLLTGVNLREAKDAVEKCWQSQLSEDY